MTSSSRHHAAAVPGFLPPAAAYTGTSTEVGQKRSLGEEGTALDPAALLERARRRFGFSIEELLSEEPMQRPKRSKSSGGQDHQETGWHENAWDASDFRPEW